MYTVTVVIPTHNRPELLREALASIVKQTYKNWEVVVVDDGSQPPVDRIALKEQFGEDIHVIRNEISLGIAPARLRGAQEARGQIIAQLDDDDLLIPEALEEIVSILHGDWSIDIVFIGTKGFGKKADAFDRVQKEGNQRMVRAARGLQVAPETYRFGKELFAALLSSVPMAFQRPVSRRDAWFKVSELSKRVYSLDSQQNTETRICNATGLLVTSEWAIYAAAICRTVLLDRPLYLQRCDGQGYSSQTMQKEKHGEALIDIKKHLFMASGRIEEFEPWRREIRQSYSDTYLGQSHYSFYNHNRLKSWHALCRSSYIKPGLRHLRFLLRTFLPRRL